MNSVSSGGSYGSIIGLSGDSGSSSPTIVVSISGSAKEVVASTTTPTTNSCLLRLVFFRDFPNPHELYLFSSFPSITYQQVSIGGGGGGGGLTAPPRSSGYYFSSSPTPSIPTSIHIVPTSSKSSEIVNPLKWMHSFTSHLTTPISLCFRMLTLQERKIYKINKILCIKKTNQDPIL
jgi:hypothetical protein